MCDAPLSISSARMVFKYWLASFVSSTLLGLVPPAAFDGSIPLLPRLQRKLQFLHQDGDVYSSDRDPPHQCGVPRRRVRRPAALEGWPLCSRIQRGARPCPPAIRLVYGLEGWPAGGAAGGV